MATLNVQSMLDASLIIVEAAGPGDHRAVVRCDGAPPVLHAWKGPDAAWTVPGHVNVVAVSIDGDEYELTVVGPFVDIRMPKPQPEVEVGP